MTTPTRSSVLVVDDDEDSLQAVAMLLRIAGHDVRTAGSGAAALAVLDSFSPSVAIIDIALPDMEGPHLARRLRAHPAAAGCAMVALSGFDPPAATEMPFVHYLVKPIDTDALLALLAAMP